MQCRMSGVTHKETPPRITARAAPCYAWEAPRRVNELQRQGDRGQGGKASRSLLESRVEVGRVVVLLHYLVRPPRDESQFHSTNVQQGDPRQQLCPRPPADPPSPTASHGLSLRKGGGGCWGLGALGAYNNERPCESG